MDFPTWLDQAWTDHATHAADVAERIDAQGLPLATTDAQRLDLARLSQHVMGSHLARWADGRAQLARIGQPVAAPAEQATLRLLDAGLALAGGLAEPPPDLPASDRVRVAAIAAGHLAEHDAARTAVLLQQALDLVDAAGLSDADPALRTLAANANGIACAMEDKPARDDAERALMLQAARAARTHWERAGTWLEVERAEYRLAMSWLKADDLPQARRHAQACLEIVREHDAAALEHFFAWEALGRVERAAGNATGHAHALAQAREAFARLEPGDTGWCRPSLEALAG